MEWAIVFATLAGPVLAVQVQRFLERGREHEARRLAIFRTLMATRMATLSGTHVEALNAVPIEFFGSKRSYAEVVTAWKTYIDHLSQDGAELPMWHQRRYDLFIELLWKMSTALGYHFTEVELKREVYSPRAHAAMEQEQEIIRAGFAKLFKGELALPLDIRTFPVDAGAAERQSAAWAAATAFFKGEASAKVQTIIGEKPTP